MLEVVAVVIHVPNMRDVLFFEYTCVRRLKVISPSLLPQEIHSTLSIWAALAGSGTSTSGIRVLA